eukprot:jgi/Hompol1/6595/HPOL_003156-RA
MAIIAIAWLLVLVVMVLFLPPSNSPMVIPHDLAGLRVLSDTMKEYSKTHFVYILSLFSMTYLFKQSLFIPGSTVLNVLAGTLYGYNAIPLCSFLAATGSTLGYLFSRHIIGSILFGNIIPRSRIMTWRASLDEYRDNMLLYLIALRTMPVVPSSFVNIASPFVGIDIQTFYWSTFIEIMNLWTLLQLALISAMIVLPTLYKDRIFAWVRTWTHSRSDRSPSRSLLRV